MRRNCQDSTRLRLILFSRLGIGFYATPTLSTRTGPESVLHGHDKRASVHQVLHTLSHSNKPKMRGFNPRANLRCIHDTQERHYNLHGETRCRSLPAAGVGGTAYPCPTLTAAGVGGVGVQGGGGPRACLCKPYITPLVFIIYTRYTHTSINYLVHYAYEAI